ncbi:MAG: hypothetical protein HOP96_12420 [Sphingomonas sp.]|nr:hypothetical protein [Sphingomonas sp.]
MTLALYGHPFSSYTWKALIALYANETPFEFREIDQTVPKYESFTGKAHPSGQFPVLTDRRISCDPPSRPCPADPGRSGRGGLGADDRPRVRSLCDGQHAAGHRGPFRQSG